jgi:flagellar basal-body rod protein FlgB
MSIIDTPRTQALSRALDFQVFRAGLISSNLANIDTPGYRTRDVSRFARQLEQSGGGLSYAGFLPVVSPGPGLSERPDGNNVSLERETLLLAETQMRFSLGVQFLKEEFHMISTAIHEGGSS